MELRTIGGKYSTPCTFSGKIVSYDDTDKVLIVEGVDGEPGSSTQARMQTFSLEDVFAVQTGREGDALVPGDSVMVGYLYTDDTEVISADSVSYPRVFSGTVVSYESESKVLVAEGVDISPGSPPQTQTLSFSLDRTHVVPEDPILSGDLVTVTYLYTDQYIHFSAYIVELVDN